jgi:hypothetical protein
MDNDQLHPLKSEIRSAALHTALCLLLLLLLPAALSPNDRVVLCLLFTHAHTHNKRYAPAQQKSSSKSLHGDVKWWWSVSLHYILHIPSPAAEVHIVSYLTTTTYYLSRRPVCIRRWPLVAIAGRSPFVCSIGLFAKVQLQCIFTICIALMLNADPCFVASHCIAL